MTITRTSPVSGKDNTMHLPITEQQMAAWLTGMSDIQTAFPHLDADQREFLKTGMTPEDWSEVCGEDVA